MRTQEEKWAMLASVRAKRLYDDARGQPGALLAEAVGHYHHLNTAAAVSGLPVPRLSHRRGNPFENPALDLAASFVALAEAYGDLDRVQLRRRLIAMAVRGVDDCVLGRYEPVEDAEAAWEVVGDCCLGVVETGISGMAGNRPMMEEFVLRCEEAAAATIMVLALRADAADPFVMDP